MDRRGCPSLSTLSSSGPTPYPRPRPPGLLSPLSLAALYSSQYLRSWRISPHAFLSNRFVFHWLISDNPKSYIQLIRLALDRNNTSTKSELDRMVQPVALRRVIDGMAKRQASRVGARGCTHDSDSEFLSRWEIFSNHGCLKTSSGSLPAQKLFTGNLVARNLFRWVRKIFSLGNG